MSKPQRAAISAEATNCFSTLAMSARSIAFGTWLAGDQAASDAAITGQLPLASGASLSCQPSCVEPFGPEWPTWAQILASVSMCTKSTRRIQAASCSGA
jgi:hypothetical protein